MKYSFKQGVYINWKGTIAEDLTKHYVTDILIPKLKKEGWYKVFFTMRRKLPSILTEEVLQNKEEYSPTLYERLDNFLEKLPEEYKVFPSPSKSKNIYILDKSGQATLIYGWETCLPVTPRKSVPQINKSRYKRMEIHNKVLLARKFSVKTKKLASEVKNLLLIEVEPSKCQTKVEGEIGDQLLISLLLKEFHSPSQISERELLRARNARKHKGLLIFFLSKGVYPNPDLLDKCGRIGNLLEHQPDGFLFKLSKTGVKLMKDIISEIGEGGWQRRFGDELEEFSTQGIDEFTAIPIVSGEIEIVEIKSDKGKLSKAQKTEYSNLVSNGFPLRLFHVRMISFVENHFEIEEKLLRTTAEVLQTRA